MPDIIEQLREKGAKRVAYPRLFKEAADEIERLRSALKEIADRPAQYEPSTILGQMEMDLHRAARAALSVNA
jgi:hypothetical protein